MKRLKISLSLLLLIMVSVMFSGCWNYREINDMAIVTSIAIDKDIKNNKYDITLEIAHSEHGEKGGRINSKIYKGKGDTIFEGIRDLIAVIGQRAYWSHTKVVIISKAVAENDISPVLDWLFRDQELRRDIDVFISKSSTSEDILYTDPELQNTVGFSLSSTIKNQKSSNRFPRTVSGDIANNFAEAEKSILIPLVGREKGNLNKSSVYGSAILKRERVVGYLSGEDTFNSLWLQGKVKVGTFVIKELIKPKINATIEIFNTSTKTKTINFKDGVKIVVNISADIALAELSDVVPFDKKEKQEEIKKAIEKDIEERLINTIKMAQGEYKTDIFNFYDKVRIYNPKYYKKVSLNWGEEFSHLPVEVKADVHIRGSQVKSKQIKEGD